jgi:hypothetical protein
MNHEPSIERIEPFVDIDKGILSLRWFCCFADCIERLIGTSKRCCRVSSCGWAHDVHESCCGRGDAELQTWRFILLLLLLLRLPSLLVVVLLPMTQLLVLGLV